MRRLWIACALATAAAGCGAEDAARRSPAPDFRLDTLSHRRFYLNRHRGRTVVLVFWETSCVPCKRAMRDLAGMHRELAARGLVVAAVCADPQNMDRVRRVKEGLGLGYPLLLDRGGAVQKAYGVIAFPTIVVIGPDGTACLRRVGYGEGDARAIRTHVDRLLAGQGDVP